MIGFSRNQPWRTHDAECLLLGDNQPCLGALSRGRSSVCDINLVCRQAFVCALCSLWCCFPLCLAVFSGKSGRWSLPLEGDLILPLVIRVKDPVLAPVMPVVIGLGRFGLRTLVPRYASRMHLLLVLWGWLLSLSKSLGVSTCARFLRRTFGSLVMWTPETTVLWRDSS